MRRSANDGKEARERRCRCEGEVGVGRGVRRFAGADRQPLQYSMRRMFVAVLLFAVAFRLFMLYLDTRFDATCLQAFSYFGFFILSGAAFGCLEGRILTRLSFGAFCGIVLAPFLLRGCPIPAARE
jgi:hypothetical protein